MKDFAIYLDLDGVLADYSTGMEQCGFVVDRALKLDFNKSGTSHPLKRQMYEAVKGTDFYRNLPLMPGALALYEACADAEPIILTAAPKFGGTEDDYFLNPYWLGAAYHKRTWVEDRLLPAVETFDHTYDITAPWDIAESFAGFEHTPVADERFICTTSARKHQFMHRKKSDYQILIDDRIANVEAWAKSGGIGVLHVSAKDSIRALEEFKTQDVNLFPTWRAIEDGWLFDPRVPA